MAKAVTVAISGAAGQIGYALLPRIASGQMFGPDLNVKLRLLELDQSRTALDGVVMELDDCAFPQLESVVCTSDPNTAMDGADWVLLVGSVPRKQGMERSDLLQINGGIFTEQGKALSRAASGVRVFVVGNPCNTNALIAMNSARDIPNDRFYAMTALDEKRARNQLAKKAGVPVTAVTEMTIWGNHSSTQYPDFFNAKINGSPVTEVISDRAWLENEFITTVQQRGAAIIKARGASSAASAANGVIASVNQLITETPSNESFSVCLASKGQYGIPEGLIFSMPCRVVNGQLRVIEGLQHNDFGKKKLQLTLDELLQERDAVKELGLI